MVKIPIHYTLGGSYMDHDFSQPTQQTMELIQQQLTETRQHLKQFKNQANGIQRTNITQAIRSIENAASQLRQVPPSL